MKNKSLNQWLWKWHVIAGLISLPVVLVLSLTGAVYLFKGDYEQRVYQHVYEVPVQGTALSLSRQLLRAEEAASRPITQVVVPRRDDQATQFVSGRRSGKRSVYIDPYSGEVTGELATSETFMYKVRKLHGELLLGDWGTKVVELVASWLVVLILTGLYVWWPARGWSLAGFFTIRRHRGRRIFLRDLHAVGGFWLSLMLLVILAGGMPWTDVFGAQFKRLQNATGSGYPATWGNSRGLRSVAVGEPMDLDQMASLAVAQGLEGEVTIRLPAAPESVFTVANRAHLLRDQRVIHFDQYSGAVVEAHAWSDVGSMMTARQVFMRLHQGEYGALNWGLVLLTAVAFFCTSLSALASYWLRRPANGWGLPKVPESWVVGRMLIALILVLGVLLPLFGLSLVLIWLWENLRGLRSLKGEEVPAA